MWAYTDGQHGELTWIEMAPLNIESNDVATAAKAHSQDQGHAPINRGKPSKDGYVDRQLAKEFNVGHATIAQARKVKQSAPELATDKLLHVPSSLAASDVMVEEPTLAIWASRSRVLSPFRSDDFVRTGCLSVVMISSQPILRWPTSAALDAVC
jgi:hypothetical protein